jgi:hypothetical protein
MGEAQLTGSSTIYLGGSAERKVTYRSGNKAKIFFENCTTDWEVFKKRLPSNEGDAYVIDYVRRMLGLPISDDPISSVRKFLTQDLTDFIQHIRKISFLHEPLAWSIREVFFRLVHIYEGYLARLFDEDTWKMFMTHWNEHDPESTSSKPLWNLTRDETFREAIRTAHPNLTDWVNDMEFSYIGFCPKVPGVRLRILLNFPVRELIEIMEWDDAHSFEEEVSKRICAVLANTKTLDMKSLVSIARPNPPPTSLGIVELVDLILQQIEKILPALESLEKHYLDKAELFNRVVLSIDKLGKPIADNPPVDNKNTDANESADEDEDGDGDVVVKMN